MAYNALNNLIDAYIYANGVQAITGQILNGVLKQMVSQLGSGYHLMGVAGPETVPASNDYAMAYFAATAGEYTDFGGITLAAGEVAVLLTSGNGSWSKQTIYNVPTTTEDLENTSGFITNAVTDLVNYYTKTEVDDTLANYPTLEALATALADYYTKTEIDGQKAETDAALGDRYTKSETDTKLEDYYKKTETYDKDEVDSIVAALSRQEYIIAWDGLTAPDVSAIPAGVTVTYSGTPYTGTLAASASTVNKIYMVWNGVAYDMYGTSQDGGYSWVPMGTTSVDLSQYATKAEVSQLEAEVTDLEASQNSLVEDKDSLFADYENVLRMELGGINGNDGKNNSVANRARTPYISAPFSIVLNSGYGFNYVYRYQRAANGDLSYIDYESISGTQFSATDTSYVYRVVISKTSGTVTSDDVNETIQSYTGIDLLTKFNQLGDRIASDEKDLESFENKFANFHVIQAGYDFDWQQGGIISGGGEPTSGQSFYSNRVKSGNYFQSSNGSISCVMNTAGYGYRIMLYNASKVWQSQDLNDDGAARTLNIPDGYYIRFVLLKTNSADITPEEANNVDFVVAGLTDEHKKTYFERPLFSGDFDSFSKGLLPNYVWMQGAINGDGGESTVNNRVKTGTYFLSHGEDITINIKTGYQFRIFYYNSGKVFIDWTHDTYTESQIFSTTSGYYYRFVVLKADGTDITPEEVTNEVFSLDGFLLDNSDGKVGYIRPLYKEDIQTLNDLSGKKVAFIGDSITAGAGASSEGNRFYNVFSRKYGCVPVNLGVNATTIASNPKNGLNSTRFVTRATAANLGDVDMVVVFGGTNDLSYDSKAIGNHFVEETITPSGNIGNKKLSAPIDTDTFSGALHDLITTIQSVVPARTPILFMTPLHRNNNVATNPNYTQANENGDYMIDFVAAIKDICSFYAIPVLDLYSASQLNPLSPAWSGLFSDGLHPNDVGHKIIGELLFRFVEQNVII